MINEAVILLGGMGTRLLPYTKTVSKEMLPIYDVPVIFLLVKEAYLSGIKKIIFVTTEHNQDLIKKFFSKDEYLDDFLKDKSDKQMLLNEVNDIINNMSFTYVNQELKGTYGALYSAKEYISSDNFIVMYGDDLIDSTIPITKKLIDEYNKTSKMQVAIYKKDYHDLPNVGVVKLDNENNIIDLVPKDSENSGYEIHGRMLLNKKIFDVLDLLYKHNNEEYYLPYALLKFKGDVKGYIYNDRYFNIGDKLDYLKANIYYNIKNNHKKDELIRFINNIKED